MKPYARLRASRYVPHYCIIRRSPTHRAKEVIRAANRALVKHTRQALKRELYADLVEAFASMPA